MRQSIALSLLVMTACAATPSPEPKRAETTRAEQVAPPPVATPARSSLDETVRALQASALASTKAEETVRSLTSEVGARIAGGPKDAIAVAWAKRAMEGRGLTRVHAEPVKVLHWERGEESVELVGKGARKLRALGLGGTLGTGGKPIEAEVVEVASVAALNLLPDAAVRGRIVFYDAPMRRSRDGSGYGDAVGVRYEGPRRAGEKGALAAVIRSVGTDVEMPHTGATLRTAKVPVAALSGESADALHAALVAGKHARLRLSLGARWLPDAESENVIGDVVGSEHPDEIVILGAHLDSWDVGQGAIDDGAGCAIVLEAARLVAALGRAPKRTVRVVLFASEEMGVFGGEAYAAAHAAELGKHVVVMEADSGTAKVYEARYRAGPSAAPVFAELGRLLAPLGVATTDARARGGADVRAMIDKGVPVVDLDQDFSRYFDVHHTDNDTFERIEPDGLRQSAAAYATAAWTLADSNVDLGRVAAPAHEE